MFLVNHSLYLISS